MLNVRKRRLQVLVEALQFTFQSLTHFIGVCWLILWTGASIGIALGKIR